MKAEPVRFSMLMRVSVPAPPVSWAVRDREADGHGAVGIGVAGGVAVGTAVQAVVAIAAIQRVVAGVADELVIAALAGDGVVAAAAVQHIGAVVAGDAVAAQAEPMAFSIEVKVVVPRGYRPSQRPDRSWRGRLAFT